MKLFRAVNNGEILFVTGRTKEEAFAKLRGRLLRKYGKYNITDIKEISRK